MDHHTPMNCYLKWINFIIVWIEYTFNSFIDIWIQLMISLFNVKISQNIWDSEDICDIDFEAK